MFNFQIKSYDEYLKAYKNSIEQPEIFWGEIASQFYWRKKWSKVCESDFSKGENKWFIDGKLNITENCLDVHLENNGEKIALIWEPNNPNDAVKKYTYSELHYEVCRAASVLINLGIKKGDRVCIYMGMTPELPILTLACARIGAIHSVIFAGFSAQSIADRINDAQASFVITCDASNRGNKIIDLKSIVDKALTHCNTVKKVLVVDYLQTNVAFDPKRDVWYHEALASIQNINEQAVEMDSEDPLFILYTSGSTGKPKGVVHSCGGYMVNTCYTFINVFQTQANDIFFCTADIGWITGHSYIIYGPLSAGSTIVLFEGIPTYPDAGRFWQIVEKHQVNILYTAPTAIRSLMRFDIDFVNRCDLSSLRVLGTVGEPINEEAWHWYKQHIGKNKCPIVDTWWQTETGAIMLSNLAGITPEKPCFATLALPGVKPVLLNENGQINTENNQNGNLCIAQSWTSIIRTTYDDHQRCISNYFSLYPNYYTTGDGAYRDENGFYRITGRIDDVLNVSGHRIGTAELENVINLHNDIVESAIVGVPHDIKGQGIVAFVVAYANAKSQHIEQEILILISETISPIAKPDKIVMVSSLPKTRSGKIMRRILRKIAEGELQNIGDTSTLLDPSVVDEIKANFS